MTFATGRAASTGPAAADAAWFRLFAMHRAERIAPPHGSTSIDSDEPIFDFLSIKIAEELKPLCTNLSHDDALRLLLLIHTRPESSVLAGCLWQPICRAVLSGDPLSSRSVLGGLRRMHQAVAESPDSQTITFFDNTSTPGVREPIVICNTEQGLIKHSREKLSFASPATTPASAVERLPVRVRTVRAYDDATLEDVTPLDTDDLFVPKETAGNSPLFDAFFFEITKLGSRSDARGAPPAPDGSAVLWVFQFAAPKTETRDDEIGRLTTLIANAMNIGYELTVKYVLVAPQREDLSVGWQLPKSLTDDASWSACGSEVYAQYIDVDGGWSQGLLLADIYVPITRSSLQLAMSS